MTLRALLEPAGGTAVAGSLDVEVGGLALDSRRVKRGDAFFALAGARADGAAFVADAERAGAAAIVAARRTAWPGTTAGAVRVEVDDPRLALARAASRFHGDPGASLRVVGVTGTNGKTTTTYLVEAALAASGVPAGLVGTTGVRLRGEQRPSALTTPDALALFALLAEMRDRGVAAVALELSSHALHQRRAWGLDLDAAVFTNLSHDHLDYHGTLAAYLDAKLMMFDGRNHDRLRRPCRAVVNVDDPSWARVVDAARRGGCTVTTYGEAPHADLRIAAVTPSPDGLAFTLEAEGAFHAIRLPLLGRYNAWNAAAAFGAVRALGVPAAAAAAGLAEVTGVPGRLERVEAGQPFGVVVDYAHTPDALERAIAAAREHAAGRVLLVFGCGGDRDRSKRPAMGRVAARDAALAWITNDNPRGEDPAAIAAEIEHGTREVAGAATRVRRELDRARAIAAAIAAAGPGDLVLIAGKGHETTQTIGVEVLPFDDREVARAALAGRGGAR